MTKESNKNTNILKQLVRLIITKILRNVSKNNAANIYVHYKYYYYINFYLLEIYNCFDEVHSFPSGKGGTCLLHKEYMFTHHITNSDSVCFYRCKEHKKKSVITPISVKYEQNNI